MNTMIQIGENIVPNKLDLRLPLHSTFDKTVEIFASGEKFEYWYNENTV